MYAVYKYNEMKFDNKLYYNNVEFLLKVLLQLIYLMDHTFSFQN